jgi:hypothetical protein
MSVAVELVPLPAETLHKRATAYAVAPEGAGAHAGGGAHRAQGNVHASVASFHIHASPGHQGMPQRTRGIGRCSAGVTRYVILQGNVCCTGSVPLSG